MSEIITLRARQNDETLEGWQVTRIIFEAFNQTPEITRFTTEGLVPVEGEANARVLDVIPTGREGEFDISINSGDLGREALLLKFSNLAHVVSLVQ